jgi:diguanylate cyclase (GGDEF)-like protein
VGQARNAASKSAAKPGLITQVFEKVRTELLAALLALALFAAAMSLVWLRERGRVRKVQRQAEVDPLTGIPNRLAFEQRLIDEWRRARRYDRALGVLLLDLDGLKGVNDSGGHEAGDRMISAAAERISDNIRASDFGARLAGDEFVVLCPETSAAGLEHLGEKLTQQLDQAGIGVSVGWAELGDRDAPADLLARADAAMYQEKTRRKGAGTAPTARPDLAIGG